MADAKIRLSVDGAAIAKAEIDRVNASLGGLGGGADLAKTALAGLAGTITAGAFLGMIRGAIDSADKLNDLSKSTGLAIETLSGLKLASKQSGADLDGTAASINKLSVNIGKNAEKFAALGVTAKDPLEAFKQLSDVFKNIDDPQLRAAVGAEALGKSWASAAPLLMEGGKNIQEMTDRGAKLAGVNTEMAEAADAFNDKLAILTGTGGLMNGITATMLPLLNTVADELVRLKLETDSSGTSFSLFTETLKPLIIIGSNIAFVFKTIANEVKAANESAAAMYSFDWTKSNAIADAASEKAKKARADLDYFQEKVMAVGGPNTYVKDLFGSSKPKPPDTNSAAAIAAANRARAFVGGGSAGGSAASEKISEYARMEEAIKKVTAMQEQELLYGGKLVASDKFQIEELQKITFAFSTHKISQQERLRLIELTTVAAGKMLEVEKQAALVKSNQAQYAEQVEFAKELADAEVSLSKAREQGRAVLAEYSQSIDAENAFTALEISLVGQTEEAKKKAIALYRVELDLRKQLAAIDANAGFDGAQRAEAAAAANATAAIARAGVSSRAQLDAAEKSKQEQVDLWKSIDSTAESVFMNIARNGKGAFKSLEDELKNGLLKLLYDSTVKPLIIKIGTEITGNGDLGKLMGGDKSGGSLLSFINGLSGNSKPKDSSASDYKNGSDTQSDNAIAGTADSLGKLGEAAGIANAGIIAQTIATVQMGIAAVAAAAQMAVAFVIANPITSFFVAVGAGIAALFSFGKKEAPTVLNNLELFNNSLVGLPFLELSLSSDQASQGLRDVLYGLDNATPTMRKLAGETINLSKELLIASGDIVGARNLARNLDTRGMSEAEIAVYDYNEKLREQIQAQRDASAAASAGAAAAQAAKQAEDQLAQTRWSIAGKLNILLGRTTQLEFDRATALAATADEASIAMLKLTYQMEDLYTAVDANYAKLERSIAAEKKIAETRLKGATDLQNALKTAYDAISPSLDRASAQSQIAMYVALAKAGGVLPTAAMLKPALDAVAKPATDLFKTFSDYAIDQARTANDIADLSDYADKQVSTEQQTIDRLDLQLENAKQALDVLKGVDNSITTAAAADAAFYAAMLALSNAKASAPAYTYAAPVASSGGGGGGGGGGSYGGGSAAGGGSSAADIAGMDSDIVAAYNAYYGRNPDRAGYEGFEKSNLTGDAMMKAILRASIADKAGADYAYAMAHGFDPENPALNFYHGKNKYKATGAAAGVPEFAVGINNVPYDMTALIHKDERIMPAADNRELFARLREPKENNAVLVAELQAVRQELVAMKTDLALIRATNKEIKDITVKSDSIGPAPARAVA